MLSKLSNIVPRGLLAVHAAAARSLQSNAAVLQALSSTIKCRTLTAAPGQDNHSSKDAANPLGTGQESGGVQPATGLAANEV